MMARITRLVRVDLGEVAESGMDLFLVMLSERATGKTVLRDIGFRAVSVADDGNIVVEVTGDDEACREAVDWKDELAVGDEVYYSDPNDGQDSAIYKIVEIVPESPKVYRLANDDGWTHEAYAEDLS